MKSKSLKRDLLMFSVIPILVLGIVVTFVASQLFTRAMQREIKGELANTAYAVCDMLDIVFPGDYVKYGETVLTLVKGENILNDRSEFIDSIQDDTGLEISIFYENIRFLTTVEVEEDRILGSYAHTVINHEVYEGAQEKFYHNVEIGGKSYYAFYLPLFNSDGSCVGMIGVAKSTEEVSSLIRQAVRPIFFIAILIMVMAGAYTLRYSNKLVRDLMSLRNFMVDVAAGKLKTEFNYEVMKRDDEVTEMCNAATKMQHSLRELIEQDALTQLDNRRSGNNYVREYHRALTDNHEKFAMVLGDIDFFKKVNDTYGHDAGDEVLKSVAAVLKKHLRGKGFAARWGGEEFLLGFQGYSVLEAKAATEDILKEIRAMEVVCEDKTLKVTMSFGVSKGLSEKSVDEIIKAADDHLYYAKEHGRNQVVAYIEGEEIYEDDLELMHPSNHSDESAAAENGESTADLVDEGLLQYIEERNAGTLEDEEQKDSKPNKNSNKPQNAKGKKKHKNKKRS